RQHAEFHAVLAADDDQAGEAGGKTGPERSKGFDRLAELVVAEYFVDQRRLGASHLQGVPADFLVEVVSISLENVVNSFNKTGDSAIESGFLLDSGGAHAPLTSQEVDGF